MKKLKQIFLTLAFVLLMVSCFVVVPSKHVSATSATATTIDSYYLSKNSNVDTIHATTLGAMPCIGDAKIVVFYVDFQDGDPLWSMTKEEVENLFFSETAKNDSSLAYSDKDSLRSYYYRSSYGKVDITGTVYEYQAQESTKNYCDNADLLYNEIVAHYQNLINWDDFDGNNDGYIDGIYIVAKNAPIGEFLWPYSYVSSGAYTIDVGSKKTSNYAFIGENLFATILHETCHMFGVPDVYEGVGLNPAGILTKCIMENGEGDLPSPTKFIFGWLDNVTFISSDNVGFFDLRSYSYYGDVLIVYPNGDKTNRNWFFVEYVTNEGNNGGKYPFDNSYGEYGVRIWRTQMMLDENYNVIGEDLLFSVSSPYEYLESVHPWGIYNYYMQCGDGITPYTEISTAYSDTFYIVGKSKHLKDLTFSGIHISFDSLQNGVATVSVEIENEPNLSPQKAEITPETADQSTAFLNNNDSILFATITSECELKIDGSIAIVSQKGDMTFELETELSYNKKTVQLYVSSTMLSVLKQYEDWKLSVSDLTTYYKAPINIENGDQTFDFSAYKTALTRDNEVYNTGFSMDDNTKVNYRFRYFKLSETVILSIYFDDIANKLYWGEIDTLTNTASKTELKLPDTLDVNAWMNRAERRPIETWEKDGYYFIFIGDHICCYRDKMLVTSLDCTDMLSDVTKDISLSVNNTGGYFMCIADGTFYDIVLENDTIVLNSLPFTYNSNQSPNTLYSFVDDKYVFITNNGRSVRFYDVENNIFKDFVIETDDNPYKAPVVDMFFVDDAYFVFSVYDDLTLYKFDKDFNLLSQNTVLKDFSSSIASCYRIEVTFYNNTWVVSFDGTSLGYVNSYLLLCAKNGQVLNYYKYGDASDLYVSKFIPLSPYKILMIDESPYYITSLETHSIFTYVRTDCEGHTLGDWIEKLAPSCTAEGYSQRDCANCDYFEIDYIPSTGHACGNWVETLAPTCTKNGEERRDCANCDHYETKEISATEHSDIDDDGACDKCGWKENAGLSIGAIVGIVLGAIATVGVVAFACWFSIKKKRLSNQVK